MAGSLPAAAATLAVMHCAGVIKGSSKLLTFWLGVALLLPAVVVAYQKSWHAIGLRLERWITTSRQPALTVVCGAVLGILVSITLIGVGAIGATLIMLLYPRLAASGSALG